MTTLHNLHEPPNGRTKTNRNVKLPVGRNQENAQNFRPQDKDCSSLPQPRNFLWSVATSVGRRPCNEDIHKVLGNLNPPLQNCSYVGVFDGHGGVQVAVAASQGILQCLFDQPEVLQLQRCHYFQKYNNAMVQLQMYQQYENQLAIAVKRAFKKFDQNLRKRGIGNESGTTATIAIIAPSHIIVANCGDSKAMLLFENGIIQTTKDHKPDQKPEISRIKAAGEYIEHGRVRGRLAVSRALGDFSFKQHKTFDLFQQAVSPEPDVYIWRQPENLVAIIIACDGLWDVMAPSQVSSHIQNDLKFGVPLWAIAENLIKEAYTKGSQDNITVALLQFQMQYQGTQDQTLHKTRNKVFATANFGETKLPTDRTINTGQLKIQTTSGQNGAVKTVRPNQKEPTKLIQQPGAQRFQNIVSIPLRQYRK